MFPESSFFLQLFKTTIDAIRGTSDLIKKSEIEKALLEMRREYIELLSAYQESIKLSSELEDELRKLKEQDSKLQRYELFQHPTGALVYRIKEARTADEPTHYICATCVEKNTRSYLQPSDDERFLVCHNCGNKVKIRHDRPPVDPTVFSNPWKRDGTW